MIAATLSLMFAALAHDAVRYANLGARYRKEGSTLLAEKSLLRAQSLWLQAGLENSPNGIRTGLLLADLYASQGIIEKAEPLAAHALASLESIPNPRPRDLAAALAILAVARQSESLYLRALDLEPANPVRWNNLGVFYKAHGRASDAERCYRHALQRDPDSPAVLHNLGILELETGRPDLAEAHLLQALRAGPADTAAAVAVLTAFAQLRANQGRRREAKRCIQRAREMQARLDHANQRDLTVSIESLKAASTSLRTSPSRHKPPATDAALESRESRPEK